MADWQAIPQPVPSPDRLDVFGVFRDAVKTVWGEGSAKFIDPALFLSALEPPDAKVLAALGVTGRPYAIGDHLIRRAHHYTLYISTRLLASPTGDIRRVMLHEAIHVGVHGHGQDFRELARKHGANITEVGLTDPRVHVQLKVGARFKTVRSFDDETLAWKWAREERERVPGRYRVAIA